MVVEVVEVYDEGLWVIIAEVIQLLLVDSNPVLVLKVSDEVAEDLLRPRLSQVEAPLTVISLLIMILWGIPRLRVCLIMFLVPRLSSMWS